MDADNRRVLTLLLAAGGVVYWLSLNYSQTVAAAYLLLLGICAVVYWRPPKTSLDYLFLGAAFVCLWLHINSADKDLGTWGVVASLAGYLLL